MKTKKMSLANIQGKLSRAEMKNIMAGSGGSGNGCCCSHYIDASGFDQYVCGQTEEEAKASADADAINYGNGHWCCDSCQISNPCIP